MFDSIGETIKTMAVIICIIGIIAAVICGISMFSVSVWLGIGIIVGGSFGTVVCGCCLEGFGQLIEDVHRNLIVNESLLSALSRNAPATASQTTANLNGDAWRCKMCNSINHKTQKSCGNCGESRS